VNAIQPEEQKKVVAQILNLNCMGAGEEAPPKTHKSDISPRPQLRGNLKTLNVLLLAFEVTSKPRVGHTAMPTPGPQNVVNVGTATRVARSTRSKVAPASIVQRNSILLLDCGDGVFFLKKNPYQTKFLNLI
jgi:hypothetical protein